MSTWLLLPFLASMYILGILSERNACAVEHKGVTEDDTPAVLEALQSCETHKIIFSANTTYNIFTPLKIDSSDITISIQGNLSLPSNITCIQAEVNASVSEYWIEFTGRNVTITGSTEERWGWINSFGQQWWDASNQVARPHLISFAVTDGYVENLKLYKPIAWCINLGGAYNVVFRNTVIDARSSTDSFPFNTDGFDVSGSNIIIEDSVILNGDDAIAIGQSSAGTRNVTFRRAYVGYASHGASIGSLGENQAEFANVSDIVVEDVFFENTLYAARFKSWEGGQGLVKNVTYRNIGVQNVSFPLYITQSYVDQETSGPPRLNNASVMMDNFTYEHFWGTINTYHQGDGSCVSDPCWYFEPGADGTQAIVFRCNVGACQNFRVSDIKVRPQSGVPATIICNSPPVNPSSINPGYQCINGTFLP